MIAKKKKQQIFFNFAKNKKKNERLRLPPIIINSLI